MPIPSCTAPDAIPWSPETIRVHLTHALTGCDFTSSLFGIEEKAAYQALSKKVTTGNALAGLRNANVLESWMEAAIELVLAMYRKRAKACKTLDELRYLLATTSDKPATQLPPTEDAFWQHALRAHLQTLIWTQSHIAKPNIPDPDGHESSRRPMTSRSLS